MERIAKPSKGDARMMCFDTARALAIIVVLFVHCHGIPWGGLYLTTAYMPVFFLAAGYFAHTRSRSVGGEVRKHAGRLLKPYFAYSALLLGVSLWQQTAAGTLYLDEFFRETIGVLYARNQLYVPGTEPNVFWFSHFNYPLWFLPALFVSYLVFFPLARWCAKKWWRWSLAGVALLGVTLVLNHLSVLLPWGIDVAFLGAFFLLCGVLLGRTRCFTARVSPLTVGLLAAGTALYVVLCRYNGPVNLSVRQHGEHGGLSVLLGAFLGVLGSVLFVWLGRLVALVPVAGKALAAVGRHTLPILCLHRLCMWCIDVAFGWFGVSFYQQELFGPPQVYWLCVTGKVVLSLVMCMGLARAASLACAALGKAATVVQEKYKDAQTTTALMD